MIDVDKMRALGSPWCVTVPLTADSPIAIPQRANYQGTYAGGKAASSDRVVVLGFFYSYYGDAVADGFELVQRDFSISPGGATDIVRFGSRLGAANTTQEGCIECFLPLSKGVFTTPNSTTMTRPAELHLDVNGPPLYGYLTIWGVFIDGEEGIVMRPYGSPLLTPHAGGLPNTTPDYMNTSPPFEPPFNQ